MLDGKPSALAVALEPGSLRLVAPVLALGLFTFGVLFLLGVVRVRSVQTGEYPLRYFELMQTPEGMRLSARVEAFSRNVVNLFEVPTLFYALVPLLLLTGLWDDASVALLWVFVALRVAHTAIHLTVNRVAWRFAAYLASAMVLFVEWVRFAGEVFVRM